MIPAAKFYYLLILGVAIAMILNIFLSLTFCLAFLAAYDLTLLLVSIADVSRVKAQRVTITRNPLVKLSIARENTVILSLQSKLPSVNLLIKDNYPQEFQVSIEQFNLAIANQKKQDLIYTVTPNKRGEFSWGDIEVRQKSPWGLMWDNWKISATQKVSVYPDLIGLKSLSIKLALQTTGTIKQLRKLGQGTEFAELREYQIGDEQRIIDWKATARRNRPIVRVLEPEKEQTIIILLDQGRLMTAQVQGIKRFDWGLNATLSLAVAGLNRGDKVGVAVFDRQINTWIAPARGTNQLNHIIESLTPLKPVLLEPDYVTTVTKILIQQRKRALVVLITDIIDTIASAELLTALSKLQPRYLPFCVTLRDTQIDKIAHEEQTKDINQAYSKAVALDILSQRELAFAQLKQKGVLVLDAPANQISQNLVDSYLNLKSKSLL